MIKRSLYPAIISFALHGGVLRAQDDAAADFKARASSEWSVLSQRITSLRCELTQENFYSQNRQPLWLRGRNHSKYGFLRDVGMFTEFEMEDFDEKGASTGKYHRLYIANEEYSAELNWGKKGKGWMLTNLKMGNDKGALQEFLDIRDIRDTTAVPWLRICDNVSVPELIQDPGFVILRIEQQAGNPGSKALRVYFRNDGWREQPTNATQCVQSGFIGFDAGHSYRVMGYEVHWKDRNSEGDRKGSMEYQEGKGIPILKTEMQEWPEQHSKKRGLMSSKNTTSLKYTYNSGPSDEEFWLSHYGLPEPMGVKPPPPPPRTWLWLLAAALAAAALAVVFTWLKRRRNRATSRPSPVS